MNFNHDNVIETEIKGDKANRDGKGTTMWEKDLGVGNNKLVTREFLKKYISWTKSQKAPEIHSDTVGYAASLYGGLRLKAAQHDQNKVAVPVTVRTLETMLRLATAHAKLRQSKSVDMEDIDVAIKLLRMTIFLEKVEPESKPVAMQIKQDDEMEEEQHIPLSRSARAQRNKVREAKEVKKGKENTTIVSPPAKRMKVDHEEQVSQLFKGTSVVDTSQKKLVFKLINAVKNNKNTCSTDEIWSQFMKSSDRDTMRKDTMESLVNDRTELVRIIESLERDNLVMYAAEDNQVVLI